jgi:DNA invertase Pin-like site-specific DNA recombinase/ribosomal protein S25
MEKLRAVTYNRCSTEEESQKDALVKQVQESKNCISEQGWVLVDTYVEAKSGTTIKGRNEYNRLYQDLETDKFDIIVIKSQDRLMRNTKDWYLFLDRMQRNRKRLYMYLDHKFYTPDDALITGIKAILAEEYSRELSKKINNAHRNRQKEGKNFVLTNQTYGYRKLPDKSIHIDEREAEMVKMIYELSANGYGTHCSAEILYRNGYCNRKGKMISPSLIRNIIRNPIYKGTVIQNKRHYDFESKQIFQNPQSEWIVHENVIPAIIDEELFRRANRGLDIRRQEGNRDGVYRKGSNPGKYDLTGKVLCGVCGSPFYRTVRQNREGKVIEWKCCNYLQNGRKNEQLRRDKIRKVEREGRKGCDNVHISEKKLYAIMEQLCRKKYQDLEMQKDTLLKKTLSLLRDALKENDVQSKRESLEFSLEKLSGQRETLLEKLLEGIISDMDYKKKEQELRSRIEQLDSELKYLENDILQNTKLECRIEAIREKLERGVIEQAQVADMISNILKIEIFPDRLEFCFDSWAVMGLPEEIISSGVRKETDKLTVISIPQTCSTSHQPMIEMEKEKILELMKQKPEITAKEIAKDMEVNLSLIHRRIRELKSEGRIRYSSPNGRGEWQIL